MKKFLSLLKEILCAIVTGIVSVNAMFVAIYFNLSDRAALAICAFAAGGMTLFFMWLDDDHQSEEDKSGATRTNNGLHRAA